MKLSLFFSLSLLSIAQLHAEQPNIIYIIADDLGYNDLSCYGQKGWKTKHIDSLAKKGIKFTQHYAGSTVCAPSRSSLITGQDQGHTKIRGNGGFELGKKDNSIAKILKSAGYQTAMIGKSCVTGNTNNAKAPHTLGFDYFYGTLSHLAAHHHYPRKIFTQGKAEIIEENHGKHGKVFIQNRYTDKALDFIEKNQKKPFFLLLSFSTPHADIDAPEEDVKPFIGKFKNEKSYPGAHYKACKHIKATYAGAVMNVDKNVGRVLEKIKQLNLEKNTIVSFTSDNGPAAEGGYHFEMHNSNGDLRGGKRDLFEGGIRVPFLVKWPAKIKAGRVSKHPSAFWDILPTYAEITKQQAPKNIQGISFLPTLLDKKQPEHKHLYWEFHELGGRVALRQGDWKLVIYKSKSKQPKYHLFNIKKDPSEKKNLKDKKKSLLKRLIRKAKDHRQKSPIKYWN